MRSSRLNHPIKPMDSTLGDSSGFSLVELMIALLLGTIALSGLITVFGSSAKANIESIKTAKLNQELRSTLDIMSRDIRRAGYWAEAANNSDTSNPFGITLIQANCILYTYDSNSDGVLDESTEEFGFRLNQTAIEIRQGGRTCDQNRWMDATDPDITTITNATSPEISLPLLNATTTCLNTSNPTQSDCDLAVSGDILRTKTAITLTLTGVLRTDPSTQLTLRSTINIRNDNIQIVP